MSSLTKSLVLVILQWNLQNNLKLECEITSKATAFIDSSTITPALCMLIAWRYAIQVCLQYWYNDGITDIIVKS